MEQVAMIGLISARAHGIVPLPAPTCLTGLDLGRREAAWPARTTACPRRGAKVMESDARTKLYQELVAAHLRELHAFAFRLCGHEQTAEDLAQETFTEAWRGLGRLRERARARAWLFGIMHNRFRLLLRQQGRRLRPVLDVNQVESQISLPGEDLVDLIARRELLQSALDALDDAQRETFLLVFVEGRTYIEAAKTLGVPIGTIKSRLHNARHLLRSELRRLTKEPGAGVAEETGSSEAWTDPKR